MINRIVGYNEPKKRLIKRKFNGWAKKMDFPCITSILVVLRELSLFTSRGVSACQGWDFFGVDSGGPKIFLGPREGGRNFFSCLRRDFPRFDLMKIKWPPLNQLKNWSLSE